MVKRLLSVSVCVAGLAVAQAALLAQTAVASPSNASFLPENQRGTYYVPDPGTVQHGVPSTIYLNRQGGNFGAGFVPPFEQGDDAWVEVVECVKYQYARFNIAVTTSQPSGSHILASVGGSAEDIGGSGFCGIAPFSCQPMRNATVYNHSECYPGNMEQLCFTIAQEVGHALGMEHQMTCKDPMTYLSGCGFKEFQTGSGNCGEFSPDNCSCGGTTQNTVSHLSFHLGDASDATKPSLALTSPIADEFVTFGFPITVNATDNRAMALVEVYIDGTLHVDRRFPPYNFKAPNSIALGPHTIEVRAFDAFNNTRTLTRDIFVTVDGNPPECDVDNDCPTDEICYNLQCWPENVDPEPEPLPGATGSPCTNNDECTGAICASSGGESLCTESCVTADECPSGFDCLDAGGTGICWPGSGNGGDDGGSSGGCAVVSTGTGGGLGGLVLLLGTCLLVVRRRRG